MSTSSSKRRLLSLWLRRLATDRIARTTRGTGSGPDDADEAPLVAAHMVASAQRIAALNDAAARLGLAPGVTVADARARHPGLAVMAHDPAADHLLLTAVADACDRWTPLVALDPPDGLMLDITGCAHLFGGEAALAADLHGRLAAGGLAARLAVADTPGCAAAVARHGPDHIGIVPPGTQDAALAPLPLAALRLPQGMVVSLAEVGLKRIADVVGLPRATLAARFDGLLDRLDAARGLADAPISPRRPLPACVAEQSFAEPVLLERAVLGTILRLAGRLARLLETRGDGARILEAALFRTDGRVVRITVGTGAPLIDPERMTRLFADRLAVGDPWDPGFGFDLVRLSALATERCDPVQGGLDASDATAELAHLVDRLSTRFGARRVTRQMLRDEHVPEFAAAALPAQVLRVAGARPGAVTTLSARRGKIPEPEDRPDLPPHDTLVPVRPLRLLERPEAVEAMAEVPDGPPVRFRWRRVLYAVAAAEGPERIALAWWRDADGTALTRDYFRVECRDGFRAWLFREGLFGRETPRPRWFLHGLFG